MVAKASGPPPDFLLILLPGTQPPERVRENKALTLALALALALTLTLTLTLALAQTLTLALALTLTLALILTANPDPNTNSKYNPNPNPNPNPKVSFGAPLLELRHLARRGVEVAHELRMREHEALVDVVREVVHRALGRLRVGGVGERGGRVRHWSVVWWSMVGV